MTARTPGRWPAFATTGARTSRSSSGVATAVAVLAGALLVGDSVRGSLRDLVLQRLGRVDRIVVSSGFFREALADEIRDGSGVPGVVRRRCSDRRRAGPGHGSGERHAGRRASRSTASTIASGSFHRRRGPEAGRTAATRSSAARSRRTSGRRPTARCSSASSGRRRFRSSRCTAARTISARTLRLTVRRGPRRVGSSASSRCGRSRAMCARCSCRCDSLQHGSRSGRPASTRCSCPIGPSQPAHPPPPNGSLEALLKAHVQLRGRRPDAAVGSMRRTPWRSRAPTGLIDPRARPPSPRQRRPPGVRPRVRS